MGWPPRRSSRLSDYLTTMVRSALYIGMAPCCNVVVCRVELHVPWGKKPILLACVHLYGTLYTDGHPWGYSLMAPSALLRQAWYIDVT